MSTSQENTSTPFLLSGSQDVWYIILRMLDGRDIIAMESVCSAWKTLVRSHESDRLLWKPLVLGSERGKQLCTLVSSLPQKVRGWRSLFVKLRCYERNLCSTCFEKLPPRKEIAWYQDEEDWGSDDESGAQEAVEREHEALKLIARGSHMSICRWKNFTRVRAIDN